MLKPGDTIDIWVVDRALGQGGMGSVYRCHNREARRILAAVKVLDASLGRQDIAKARFIREAEILFSLDHPGIVKVRNVRMDVELPYLEMEYIEGVSLEARMREGPMSPAAALPLFQQVADALAYLHGKGIRHRDLKPSNLVVQPDGTVKLVDFGIATEADGATITQQGQTFGSASYAPPEWLEPSELDPVRWDIYAAGVVFWEALTGVQAFPMTGPGSMHQQVFRLLNAKQSHPPLDPGARVPRGLRELIQGMTEPDWRRRISAAAEVRDRLAKVDLEDVDPAAAPPPPSWLPQEESTGEVARGTMVPTQGIGNITMLGVDVGDLGPKPARNLAVPPPPPTVAVPPTPPAPTSSVSLPPDRGEMASKAVGIGGAVGVVAGAFGVVALVAIVAGGWYLTRVTDREVRVTVAGPAEGVPVVVTLGGHPADRAEGRVFSWTAAPVGTAPLRAAVGTGCAAADTDPAWCAATTVDLEVSAASEPLAYTFAVTSPAPREVTLRFTGLTGAPQARVDGGAPVTGSAAELALTGVSPGPHTITAWLGTCAEADQACGASCPPGCAGWSSSVEVPAGEGAFVVDVPLAEPVAVATVATPTSPTSAAPKARSAGAVSVAAFAKWLTTHPDWTGDAARAAGKADAAYLSGWDGANPPAGKSGAMVNVSWAAASAYCAGRGGLVPVDEAPLTWTESAGQPWHEFRSAGGKPAWRRSDGATSVAVKPSESGAFIGFRCR